MTGPQVDASPLTASGPMKARLALSGASGFLGRSLAEDLERAGATVHRLVRGTPQRTTDIRWDPDAGTIDQSALEGMDAVIHLAGEPIAQRWTNERKEKIRWSRVKGTGTIARAVAALQRPPRVLLSGSAVGIYGASGGDVVLDEKSDAGSDFLARVGVEWEAAAAPARSAGVRLVFLRTGIVLDPAGGVLERLLLPFRMGLGGRFGSGRQWMSWISLDDWIAAVRFLLADERIDGPVNLVAPEPVTNDEFTRTVGFVLHRPTILPVPGIALRAVFAGMADAALLGGQRARPSALQEAGFRFRHPSLEPALESILRGN